MLSASVGKKILPGILEAGAPSQQPGEIGVQADLHLAEASYISMVPFST